MTAQTKIPTTEVQSIDANAILRSNSDEAHILHSKIVGKCATVEAWLFEKISPVQKPEMMLIKKLEQLEKLAGQNKVSYKQPESLKSRLEAFRPFAEFRSEIVHSEMTVMMCNGRIVVFFENASQASNRMLRKQIILPIEEFKEVWRNMASTANVLISPIPNQPLSSPQKQPVDAPVTPA